MSTSGRRGLPLTVAIFFLSGVSGLVYQVVWARQFGKVFGNTVHSAALVTGVFMCGLGVGSFVAGRWIDKKHGGDTTLPLRAYGVAELAIAALGVALALLLPRLTGLSASMSSYVRGPEGWYELSTGSYAVRYLIAIVTLAPSTLLMGATLTLLIRFLVARDLTSAGLRVGLLYGLNTAGAALGALLTDFALIPRLGLFDTQLVAAGINGLAGVAALGLARSMAVAAGEPAPESAPKPAAAEDDAASDRSAVQRVLAPTALALVLSGFAAMGMEIVWFRFLTGILGGLRSVLSLLLAVILLGIWGGAVLGGWLERRFSRPASLLLVAQGLFVATSLASLGLLDHAQLSVAAVARARAELAASWPAEHPFVELGLSLRSIALVVLVPSVLLGATFPLANAHVQRAQQAVGGRAGALYLANTLGNVLGSALVGFALLPGLGVQSTATFLAVVALVGLVPLYLSAPKQRVTHGAFALALGVGVAGLGDFSALPKDRLLVPSVPAESGRVLSVTEGLDETIAVTEIPGVERRLWTNGHSMSGTHPKSRRYMAAFAHLPLLSIERPERALVICFGVGSTTHAVSLHPSIEALDVADLSRHVLAKAPFFTETNGDVLNDPRTRVFVDDGRHYLSTVPDGTYDLVTLEPPPIAFAGVSALYSREFYALAKSKLRPGGYVTQWLPAYQVSGEATLSMIRAFVDVFPAAVLLSGDDNELILMGVQGATITLDIEAVMRRVGERPAVRAELEEIALDTPLEIAGTFAGAATTLIAATRGSTPLTDDLPSLEYSQRSGVRATRTPHEIFDVSRIDELCPSCREKVPGLGAYLRVRGLIYESEAFLRSGTNLPLELPPFYLPNDPETTATVASSRYLRRLFEGDGFVALDQGRHRLVLGDVDGARAALLRAAELRPDDAETLELLGVALDASGDAPQAVQALSRSVALDPSRPSARFALGALLRRLGDVPGGIEQWGAALALDPGEPERYLDYAAMLQKAGRAEDAQLAFDTALEIEPGNGRANLILCKRAIARSDLPEAVRTCDVAARGGVEIPPDVASKLAAHR